MHENWVNSRKNMRTCFQCSKLGHFVVDCPEKVENKDIYKHKSKTDGKYRSRCERQSRKKESRGKARAMDGATPLRVRAIVKMKVIDARAGSRPRAAELLR
jgi:hypothetical protein